MASDFPKMVLGMIVIILFAFLLIGFAVTLGTSYGKDTADLENRVGYTPIANAVYSINDTVTEYGTTFKGFGEGSTFENLLDVLGFLSVGIFNLAKTMVNIIIAPFWIFGSLMHNVLGVPLIVVIIIESLIFVSIIFGIWKLIKIGY